jgi:hypothetical protein
MDCAGAHWTLWNYSTGALVAQGDPCAAATPQADCGGDPSGLATYAQLAGPIAVVTAGSGFQVISTSDGSVLSSVTEVLEWYHAASDGSYICGAVPAANGGNLTVWAPDGSVLASISGNYSTAQAYCAPGQVRVANGPKGSNVIETIAVPTGTSSVSPAFAGTFNTWFGDGSAFISNVGTSVWIYSPAAVQLEYAPSLSTSAGLGGWGPWFWTADGATLNIYKVGSSAMPTASYSATSITPSGSTIGILGGTSGFGIVDLSGAMPTETAYALPSMFVDEVYAAVSASQWVVGSPSGAVVEGSTLATTPRYLGYGAINGLTGSSTYIAVATSNDEILIFNAADLSIVTTLNYGAYQLALSGDGSVLAVLTYEQNAWSVSTLSLPSGSVIHTWDYTNATAPSSITLSNSGKLLGQVFGAASAPPETCQVTSSSGGPVLWSSSNCVAPILFSLDDTLIAASNGTNTNIYLNDSPSTAVSGVAVGWLQGDDLAVDVGSSPGPVSAVIYNSAGIKQSSPTLPYLYGPIQVLSATSIYDDAKNSIYSLSTGEQTWAPPADAERTGAVAGALVVFPTANDQIVTEPY